MIKKTPPKSRVLKSERGKEYDSILKTPAKRTISTNADPSEIKSFFENIKTPETSVMTYITELEEFAKRQLKKANINYETDPSELSHDLKKGRRGNWEAAIEGQELEPVSYAGKILREIRLLRHFIAEGDLFGALNSAILMEGARGDFNFSNFEHETSIGIEARDKGFKTVKYSLIEKENWEKTARLLFETDPDNYKYYKDVALKIVIDNKYHSRALQTIEKHLSGKKVKKCRRDAYTKLTQ